VPSTVWLKAVNYNQTPPAPPAAAGTPGAAAPVSAAIGTVTFQGVGFDHDDLALWLESIAGLKTYSDTYFSSSAEGLLGQRKTVNFTSTANVTPAALSGRFTKLGG
jgi:hypothetical protein